MLPGRAMAGCETHPQHLANQVCSFASVSDKRGASLQLCYARLSMYCCKQIHVTRVTQHETMLTITPKEFDCCAFTVYLLKCYHFIMLGNYQSLLGNHLPIKFGKPCALSYPSHTSLLS